MDTTFAAAISGNTGLYDVLVVGGGYAGFAATLQLRRRNLRVLLLDPWGDLVWESGRCFVPEAGSCDDPLWEELLADLRRRAGYDGQRLEGAMAEVSATCMLQASGARVLYYAHPVSAELDGERRVQSVIVATRTGLLRVAARRYIDATEDGTLLRLAGASPAVADPVSREAYLYLHLQKPDWPDELHARTMLPTQRRVSTELRDGETANRAIMRAIAGLDAFSHQAVLSHGSVRPYPIYGGTAPELASWANVAAAVPGLSGRAIATPGERFALGLEAGARVADLPPGDVDASALNRPIALPPAAKELRADVFVAGAGTGGTFAAIAAAQQGATVLCADPLGFPGGIGVGGGIHSYYYGIPGGLQDLVDARTRQVVEAHGQVLRPHSINPVARLSVLEDLFAETGVRFLSRSFVFDVRHRDGRVSVATMVTPDGLVDLRADVFLDATGDGDLCASAGADFQLGRDADGLLHAYSQSSYGLVRRDGRDLVFSRNFDAGWCDPTDVEDLTRARLTGITQHQADSADNTARVTQLAPMIGLRQGRQIATDRLLTLDEQIACRHFDDVIGYAGSNQDTHGVDFAMESDETIFWLGLCRGWFTPLAHEISYRMLLPRGIKNVGIASRCLGVTQDAHYGLRMMRDMQRIGEAIGYAAAIMSRDGLDDLRDVPLAELQAMLRATGAIVDRVEQIAAPWARPMLAACFGGDAPGNRIAAEVAEALDHLRAGKSGRPLWIVMHHRKATESAVRAIMRESDRDRARWFAAGIAAKWGLPEAEPAMVEAIVSQRLGRDEPLSTYGRPEATVLIRTMPDWLTAVMLLRMCGSDACLGVLDHLLASHSPSLLTVLAVLSTVEALLERGTVTDMAAVERILGRVDIDSVTEQRSVPQATLAVYADNALRGRPQPPIVPSQWPLCNTAQDRRKQLADVMDRLARWSNEATVHGTADGRMSIGLNEG